MKLPQDELLTINTALTRSHGEDIAHDVVLALLRRRNPIEKPMNWARRYAAGLAKRRNSSFRQPKLVLMADLPHWYSSTTYGRRHGRTTS